MKTWLIPLTALTVSLATAGGATAFALSGNDHVPPEADGKDGPASSAVCVPGFPDCNDTIVVPNADSETGDELDTEVLPPDVRFDDGAVDDVPSIDPAIEGDPEPSFAVDEPHPLPDASEPKGPAPCEPDSSVSIRFIEKSECGDPVQVDPLPPVETPADEDSVRPVEAPAVEPGDAEVYHKEVPIGMFDQDEGSEPSTCGVAEGAPAPIGVTASSDLL